MITFYHQTMTVLRFFLEWLLKNLNYTKSNKAIT